MSCQKIVFVPVAKIAPTTVVGFAGAPIVFGVAALAVAGILAWQLKDAQDKMNREKARALELARVRAEVRRRKQEIEQFNAAMVDAGIEVLARREAERELESVRLSEKRYRKREPQVDGVDGEPAPGVGTAEKTRMLILELENLLNAVPPAYKKAERSPFSRFESEWRQLSQAFESGRPPLHEELLDFKQSLVRSLTRFQKEAQARADSSETYMEAVQSLHHDLLTLPHLTGQAAYLEEAAVLRGELSELAARGEVDRAALNILKMKIDRLKEMVETANSWQAYRRVLTETLGKRLGEMGYRVIEDFQTPGEEENQALMAVPGGERLRVTIQPDGRMAFDLLHEADGSGQPLTAEERALFRRQEQRWRRDFKALIRQLTGDGFSYEVELAKLADENAIPVAVMETAEEILAEEEERQRAAEPRQQMKNRPD